MSSISTLEQQLTSLMGDLLTQTTTTEAHWRDRIDQFIERRKAEKLAQLERQSLLEVASSSIPIDKLTNKGDHHRRPKANLFLRELLAQGQQKMLAEIFSCGYADEKTERLILSPEVLLAEMTAGLQQAAKFEEEKKLSTSSDGSGSISGSSSSGHGTAQD